jgi:uncharacterized RDD family membrane protein YckC
MVYDSLLLFAVLFAATFVLLPFTEGEAIAPNNLLYTVYILAVSFVYLGWFWTHGGQTLGMRAWGIRLVGGPQTAITWRRSLARFAGALLSWIPCGLGYLWAAFDRDRLAWHDRLSRTRLVNERRPAS